MNDYQDKALTTVVDTQDEFKNLMAFTLGLGGEAGEVLEKMKKIVRDKNGQLTKTDKQEIAKELGDTLWYIAVLAKMVDYELQEIADLNIDKLFDRKARDVLSGSGDNR